MNEELQKRFKNIVDNVNNIAEFIFRETDKVYEKLVSLSDNYDDLSLNYTDILKKVEGLEHYISRVDVEETMHVEGLKESLEEIKGRVDKLTCDLDSGVLEIEIIENDELNKRLEDIEVMVKKLMEPSTISYDYKIGGTA